MRNSRKVVHIAMHLHHELGQAAFSFVGDRVEEARQRSDCDSVRLWHDIAGELMALRQRDGGSERGGAPAALWGLMQRIEYYRRRADEVERKAADAPEACRDDMLEVAVQWRDLALLADLQARLSEQGAKLPS